jgi:hypothetical protein
MVVTSILQPNTASITDIGNYVTASFPSLFIVGCLFTATRTTKSPPRFPFPLNFKVAPSAIPRGIVIY